MCCTHGGVGGLLGKLVRIIMSADGPAVGVLGPALGCLLLLRRAGRSCVRRLARPGARRAVEAGRRAPPPIVHGLYVLGQGAVRVDLGAGAVRVGGRVGGVGGVAGLALQRDWRFGGTGLLPGIAHAISFAHETAAEAVIA